MRRPLVDPRMHAHTDTHWPSSCDILSVTLTESESGQMVPGALVEYMGDIRCIIGPLSNQPMDKEMRGGSITSNMRQRQINLNGYFPNITLDMQARVDDVTYQILGIEADSLNFSTRLKVELVTP